MLKLNKEQEQARLDTIKMLDLIIATAKRKLTVKEKDWMTEFFIQSGVLDDE